MRNSEPRSSFFGTSGATSDFFWLLGAVEDFFPEKFGERCFPFFEAISIFFWRVGHASDFWDFGSRASDFFVGFWEPPPISFFGNIGSDINSSKQCYTENKQCHHWRRYRCQAVPSGAKRCQLQVARIRQRGGVVTSYLVVFLCTPVLAILQVWARSEQQQRRNKQKSILRCHWHRCWCLAKWC